MGTLTDIRSGSITLIFAVLYGTGKGKYVKMPLEVFKKDRSKLVRVREHGHDDLWRIMAMEKLQ